MNDATPAIAKNSTPEGQFSLSLILDEIEARANAATPAPWDFHGQLRTFIDRDEGEDWRTSCGGVIDMKDATFIAAARSDVPALVKALRRAVRTLQNYAKLPKFGIDAPWALLNVEQILLGIEDIQDSSAQDVIDRSVDRAAQLLREPTRRAADSVIDASKSSPVSE